MKAPEIKYPYDGNGVNATVKYECPYDGKDKEIPLKQWLDSADFGATLGSEHHGGCETCEYVVPVFRISCPCGFGHALSWQTYEFSKGKSIQYG